MNAISEKIKFVLRFLNSCGLVLGILLNLLTILVVFKSRKLYPENNMYLISLTVSDIVHLVMNALAIFLSRDDPITLITSYPKCIYFDTLYDTLSTVSILTIMAMSFERFLAIVHPFIYKKVTLYGKKLPLLLIICMWILPCAFILPRNIYILITSSTEPEISKNSVDLPFFEISTLPFNDTLTIFSGPNTSILPSNLSSDWAPGNASTEINWKGRLQIATFLTELSTSDLDVNVTTHNITEQLNYTSTKKSNTRFSTDKECKYGKVESMLFTIALFFIPLILLLFFYTRVICCILASKKNIDRPDIDSKTKSIIKMSVIICVAFFICWLPFRLDTMFTAYSGFDYLPSDEEKILTIFTVTNFSCVINPIILYIILPNWRAGVKELLFTILPKRNKLQKELRTKGKGMDEIDQSQIIPPQKRQEKY